MAAGRPMVPAPPEARWPVNPDDPYHTFYFALSDGRVIDGGQRGNDARWINHGCAPNCEARENEAGTRVAIYALRDIPAGAELLYDYGLVIDEPLTRALKRNYRCRCGAPGCRGTMLALPAALSQVLYSYQLASAPFRSRIQCCHPARHPPRPDPCPTTTPPIPQISPLRPAPDPPRASRCDSRTG
ncbi:hypothetical protein CDEN61S_04007 [Castellaniella denitrificans]